MYEELKIEIVFLANEEIVRTSNKDWVDDSGYENGWVDGNVDKNGWV